MINSFELPDNVKKALRGASAFKRAHALKLIEDKIRLLFTENSYNVYSDINNYTSFDNFLNSFIVVKNDGNKIDWFYDEENLREIDDIKNSEFENNLFSGTLETKPFVQDSHINKLTELDERNYSKLEDYFFNGDSEFWRNFEKEGR